MVTVSKTRSSIHHETTSNHHFSSSFTSFFPSCHIIAESPKRAPTPFVGTRLEAIAIRLEAIAMN